MKPLPGCPRRDGAVALAAATILVLASCGGGSQGAGSQGNDEPVLHLAFSPVPDGSVDAAQVVTVTVLDAAGHVAGSFGAAVTLSVAAGPAGATAGGPLAVTPDHGVATFSVTLRKAGGYTLGAQAQGAAPARSSAFTLAPGAPAALAFTAPPADAVAGVNLAEVAVRLDDAWGNPTAATGTVDLAAAPGSPGPLVGTLSAAAAAGVARFSAVRAEAAGAYALRATSGALAPATSAGFGVSPAGASALRVDAAPAAAVAGETFQVVARVVDAFGNATADTGRTVEAALTPAFAPLVGTTTAVSVHGAVTFAALSVERARAGAAVTVSADGLAPGTSAPFDVTAAAASGLAFVADPGDAVAGVDLAPVRVAVVDVFGNGRADSAAAVTVALDPAGPALRGTLTRAASAGLASFGDLSVTTAGTGYTLRATSPALADAVSAPFAIRPAAAAALVFVAGPADAIAGATLPEVDVGAVDTFGNRVAIPGADVTLSLAETTLFGTLVAAPAGGIARFADLSVRRAGTGYRLSADAGDLHGTSAPFAIAAAPPHHLAFSTEPSAAIVGAAIAPPVAVGVHDAFENLTDAAVSVVLTVASTTAPGGALAGAVSALSVAGVATFGDLRPTAAGTYALGAASDGLAGATSASFDATAGRPVFAYAAPVGGRVALRLSPASTDTVAVLDLVAVQPFAAYSAALNLPIDASRAGAGAPLFVEGDALALGSGVIAAGAALPASGPLAGVVVSGASQKAGGSGAAPTNASVAAGAVLYSLRLEASPLATAGVVFDGASLAGDRRFRAAVRDRLGTEVIAARDFAVGRLEIVMVR